MPNRWVYWPLGPGGRLWHAVWNLDPDEPRIWWTRCRLRFVRDRDEPVVCRHCGCLLPPVPVPPIVGNRCPTCVLA